MARPARGAGQLFDIVAFDSLSQVPDGYGNLEQTFVEQFQLHAGFTWLRGGEAVQASRLGGQQPAVVRVRVCADSERIGADWRMRDVRTGAHYSIRGITRSADRGWFDVLVTAGDAA